jgi:murein DD-endopeptidase MepM/ murein hydrolase activator NlpD
MTRFPVRAAFVVTLLTTAACTQPPAEISLKGGNVYGQSGARYTSGSQYSSKSQYVPSGIYTSPIDEATVQEAPASAISVSDLSAPEKPKQEQPPLVIATPKAVDIQQEVKETKEAEIQKVNPWTKKPREEFVKAGTSKPQPVTAELKKGGPVVLQKPKPVEMKASESKFIWPVNGSKVISGFGPNGGGKVNDGINIAASAGEPVWAAADGEVVYVGSEIKGYGNMVLIKHSNDKTTTYAHLSNTAVDKYERVKQGDIIGYVGETGNVKKPQLHFAVREGKKFVDPGKYVSRSIAGL